MKVQELAGALLDYWVARCEGVEHPRAMREMAPGFVMVPYESEDDEGPITRYRAFTPSMYWAQGGPIIEREGIGIVKFYEPADGPIPEGGEWVALSRDDKFRGDGPAPLIAAMRAYVASKYGDEVA